MREDNLARKDDIGDALTEEALTAYEVGLRNPAAASGERAISFGPFRLLPKQRLLLEGEKPVRLGSRALDILTALVEHPGEVVGKGELMARAWPRISVEEGNLRFQISALRRTLGDGHGGNRYLTAVPGRGYSFVAPLRLTEKFTPPPPQAEPSRPHNLPIQLTRLIGRAEIVEKLALQLPRQRLLTIVGPGGIGKTSVALAVAEALIPAYEHGVWLIDLAPLSDPRFVPSALAAALGLEIRSENPLTGLIAMIRDKRMLLVVDNCEHVIDEAAALAVEVLGGAAGVHIFATSREPLRVEGERVFRLSPLPSPPASVGLTAAEALESPAIQLFVERARAALDEFELTDADASLVVDLCRKLDGMPLAIEFAAARVEAFGIRGLAEHLDERLRLLASGRRTAVPRHRTISALLDWSYQLLSEVQQTVLRRLAIFAGGFTLQAAGAVTADAVHPESEIIDQIAQLVGKSLIAAEVGDAEPRFRLLETTRAYALQKLAESGERERLARRHAEYCRDLFERADAELEARPTAEWLADYGGQIDNVRAALDWAFSPGGDAPVGAALTAAAVPLWMHLSLIEECRRRVVRALAALGDGAGRDARREMQLFEALGAALMYTRGATPETRAAFARAFEIADSLDDTDYRLRALWGLWVDRMNDGAVSDAMRLAQRFSLLASSSADPIASPIGERTMGFALHFLGDQTNARCHIERMFNGYVPKLHDRPIIRFQFDPWLTAQMRLAVILWLQGYPDQATRTVESCIGDALSISHSVTVCNAFAQGACPVALLTGDLNVGERWVTILLDHAERGGLRFWQGDARCLQGMLLIRRGDVAQGVHVLRAALGEYSATMSHTRYDAFLGELGEALGRLGDVPGGLAAVDRALDRIERTGGRWYVAELLRIKGELVLLRGLPGVAVAAEDHFRQALDWARRQGALSWELRTAMSIARLQCGQNRTDDARQLLASVYGRFTEGFGTADLRSAKRLLEELA